MKPWPATAWRGREHTTERRAIEWTCPHDHRLVVRHCGHPTAHRPYYLLICGRERPDLGAFALLARAQFAALQVQIPADGDSSAPA